MNNLNGISAEAKAAMIANLQLESECSFLNTKAAADDLFPVDARKEKLRAQCEAQCASLQSRLERRVNRIPAAKRQMLLADLLDGSIPTKSGPKKAPPVPPKAATRKQKHPTPAIPSAKPIIPNTKPKLVVAPPKVRPVKEVGTTRTGKRPVKEIEGDNKENDAGNLESKKRIRAAPPPNTRTTRANSKNQILSPKGDNSRAKKPV